MKGSRVLAASFMAAGILLGALGATLGFTQRTGAPVLLSPPQAARECARGLMDAVFRGDYDAASGFLYGTPSLGAMPQDETALTIWNAMTDSMNCSFTGQIQASNEGLAMGVQLHVLDVASVTGPLRARSQEILQQKADQASDPSEIYDAQHNYRDDVVAEALRQAVADALREDAAYLDQTLTLHLVYEDDRWWVLPEQALLTAISGGVG